MRNLSAATRQKLAILLKSKASGNATGPNASPNLAPPPISNGMSLPKPAPLVSPLLPGAEHMDKPQRFGLLKSKLKLY